MLDFFLIGSYHYFDSQTLFFCLKQVTTSRNQKANKGYFYYKMSTFMRFCALYGEYKDYEHLYEDNMNLDFLFNLSSTVKIKHSESVAPSIQFYHNFGNIFKDIYMEYTFFRKKNKMDENVKFPFFKYKKVKKYEMNKAKKEFFDKLHKKNFALEKAYEKNLSIDPRVRFLKSKLDSVKIKFGSNKLQMIKNLQQQLIKLIGKNCVEVQNFEGPQINTPQQVQSPGANFSSLNTSFALNLKLMIDLDGFRDFADDLIPPEDGKR